MNKNQENGKKFHLLKRVIKYVQIKSTKANKEMQSQEFLVALLKQALLYKYKIKSKLLIKKGSCQMCVYDGIQDFNILFSQ